MLRLIVSVLLVSTVVFASIKFEKDYEVAIETSKDEKKPLFIMVSSPKCPECNYMKKNIFTQKEVYDYIHKNFIPTEIHVRSKNIPEQMKFWGIPRFYFSHDGENVYEKKMGGMKTEQFIEFMRKGML
jgi:thioredoxin-related protein